MSVFVRWTFAGWIALGATLWTCGSPGGIDRPPPPPLEEIPNRLHLVSEDEPGEPLLILATLHDVTGKPLPDTRVWVFQTDAEGYYRKGPDGEDLGWRHARLNAWTRTDAEGRFAVETIRPGPYPGRSSPAHVHLRIPSEGGEQELTIYFEGDPRLDESMRAHLTRFDHNFIRPLERSDEGTWRYRVDLRLFR